MYQAEEEDGSPNQPFPATSSVVVFATPRRRVVSYGMISEPPSARPFPSFGWSRQHMSRGPKVFQICIVWGCLMQRPRDETELGSPMLHARYAMDANSDMPSLTPNGDVPHLLWFHVACRKRPYHRLRSKATRTHHDHPLGEGCTSQSAGTVSRCRTCGVSTRNRIV